MHLHRVIGDRLVSTPTEPVDGLDFVESGGATARTRTSRSQPGKRQLLGISLEEYFHVAAFRGVIARRHWARLDSQLEAATNTTLDLLDEYGARATFFTLGWVAENQPELLQRLVQRGHEVANSGFAHRGVVDADAAELREDLLRGHEAIVAATGRAPLGARIPDFLRERDLWALDVVAELGYAYDASFRPLGTDCRERSERRYPFEHTWQGRRMLVFPVPTMRLGPLLVPIGGGNWIRQLPEAFVRHGVARWHASARAPFALYFHVWELWAAQPRITAASWLATMRHYRNLDRTERLLRHFLSRQQFVSYAEYIGLEPAHAATRPSGGSARESMTAETDVKRVPVTVVVPCFNEADAIPFLLKTLASVSRRLLPRYQISYVFVDDGSSDETLRVLESAVSGRADCRLVRHPTNTGIAQAIMTGIAAARDEFVVSMDADCTYDPHQLADLIGGLEAGADLVTASPYHPAGRVLHVASWRIFLSHTLSRMYSRTLRANLHTYTSCFRAYRRSRFVGLRLSHGGFLGVAELIARALIGDLRVQEVPSTLEARLLGKSKLRVVRSIAGHLRLLSEIPRWRKTEILPGTTSAERSTSTAGVD